MHHGRSWWASYSPRVSQIFNDCGRSNFAIMSSMPLYVIIQELYIANIKKNMLNDFTRISNDTSLA